MRVTVTTYGKEKCSIQNTGTIKNSTSCLITAMLITNRTAMIETSAKSSSADEQANIQQKMLVSSLLILPSHCMILLSFCTGKIPSLFLLPLNDTVVRAALAVKCNQAVDKRGVGE